jgi:cell division protein FtsB
MKRLVFLFTIVILLLIIKNIVGSIFSLSDKTRIVYDLEQELARQKEQNSFLKARLSYVKSSEFVEKQARDKLGMTKPGELLVIGTVQKSKEQKTPPKPLPNWKKWAELILGITP